MGEGMSGSLVYKLDPLAPAATSLRLNDVVLAIHGVPIADDSTIEFREEERVDFTYHVRNLHVGARPHTLYHVPDLVSCPLHRACLRESTSQIRSVQQ